MYIARLLTLRQQRFKTSPSVHCTLNTLGSVNQRRDIKLGDKPSWHLEIWDSLTDSLTEPVFPAQYRVRVWLHKTALRSLSTLVGQSVRVWCARLYLTDEKEWAPRGKKVQSVMIDSRPIWHNLHPCWLYTRGPECREVASSCCNNHTLMTEPWLVVPMSVGGISDVMCIEVGVPNITLRCRDCEDGDICL